MLVNSAAIPVFVILYKPPINRLSTCQLPGYRYSSVSFRVTGLNVYSPTFNPACRVVDTRQSAHRLRKFLLPLKHSLALDDEQGANFLNRPPLRRHPYH